MSDHDKAPLAAIEALGLTVESKFVPFSQSRNKSEKRRTLNWVVTLMRNGREVISTDYSAGVAHCPCYSGLKGNKDSLYNFRCIEEETENGLPVYTRDGMYWARPKSRDPIKPDTVSVIWSLVMDSDVINSGGFESWAADMGYDTDSRAAEKIYAACLETALKLRAAIGQEGLDALQFAYQDY